tara:strand:+ start:2574 stop:2786 length:213 start_codon:yes stop_codon:yes gene_type:complete
MIDDSHVIMIASAINDLSNSIHPAGTHDLSESGTVVRSLSDAITGVDAGLVQIADALNAIAQAIQDSNKD